MATAYCPKCRTETNLEVTTCRREEVDEDGTKKTVLTRTYHCEACHGFIRSEDVQEDRPSTNSG